MENTEYSIIIEFRYGLDDDKPFYELSEKLRERMEADEAPGKYDGHEIAMDHFDARLIFFSFQPQETLSYIDNIVKEFTFLFGGRIYIMDSKNPEGYAEVEMIDANGSRTALSRFDADQLTSIPEWGVWNRQQDEDDDDGEAWKGKNERAENLFNKWREIDFLIGAIWDKWDLTKSKNENQHKEEELQKEALKESQDPADENSNEEPFEFPDDMIDWHREEMRGNSMIIPPKISGAEAGNLYVIRMENAAIIRKAANDIYLDCHFLKEAQVADKQDILLLREEISLFREYFKAWVQGFEPDEFEDEWGLFNP